MTGIVTKWFFIIKKKGYMSLLIYMLITSVWLGKTGNGTLYPVPWPGCHSLCLTENRMPCQPRDTQTDGPSLGHLDSRLWKAGM